MTTRLADRKLKTKFGEFLEVLYSDGERESIALVVGDLQGCAEVLCRIHSSCISGHVFNSIECECSEEMAAAQDAIQKAGLGLIIFLDQEGKGNGHLALMKSIPYKLSGSSQDDAYVKAGYASDARTYDEVPGILQGLGVKSITLLTDNWEKAKGLTALGVTVSGTRTISK
ncbi:MAG: GTP cyclohydrolase [bacterium]|nr:GTP cyclohydrolase [bacterium]